jgi:hypothetical protein
MEIRSTLMLAAMTAGSLLGPASAEADSAATSSATLLDTLNDASTANLFPSTSFAATEDPPTSAAATAADDETWWFQPSLTIWAAGINGTIGVRGRTTSVDASFSDILSDSDSLIGIMGTFDFGKGRLGGYVNGLYMKVGVDAGPNDNTQFTNKISLLGFGVSYDIGRWPMEFTATDANPARDLVLQLRAGGRYTAVDVDASFPVIGSFSNGQDWVDPMIGARMSIPLCQSFSFVLTGEIGGFGAVSEVAWAAGGMFSWDFHLGHCPSSLQFGYLAVGDNYSHGSGANEFVWDTVLQGPVINFVVRF